MASKEILHRAAVLKTASKILKTVKRAPRSNKMVVFLGGECDKDNPWRSEIKKEFKDTIFFIDPYDTNWDPKDNIYDELAGMLVSNHVLFYRGGKGTKKEKEFLEITKQKYREFNNLDKLRSFLKNLK